MKKFYFGLAGIILLAVWCVSSFTTTAQIETSPAEAVNLVSPNVVISQVYGGGGVAAASPFRNDFIEILNRSTAPVSLNSWSVQYSFAGSASWLTTALPNVTLAPGQYYLIQLAVSANGSASRRRST